MGNGCCVERAAYGCGGDLQLETGPVSSGVVGSWETCAVRCVVV